MASHGHGRGDAPSMLLQLMLSTYPGVRVLAAKVVTNILTGTTKQVERILSNVSDTPLILENSEGNRSKIPILFFARICMK